MSFSSYFIEFRKERNLTQKDLAKILKISNTSLRNIEKGRTAIPNYDIFYSLVKYMGGDPIQIAYDIFFKNSKEDYDHDFVEINKRYLANRWVYCQVINIAPRFIYKKDQVLTLDGTYWKAGFPYYKVAIRNINTKEYMKAISSEEKTERIIELIFRDSSFIEYIDDLDHIREVRFVLDRENADDCLIFEEIKKIRLKNLGREVEVSFVLFDPIKMRMVDDKYLHYVTKKKSLIVL